MTYKGPEFGRTDRVVTKKEDFSSTTHTERTPFAHNYFPFPPQLPSFPYPYTFPYSYGPPYSYFSNPYYPPYPYFPQQQQTLKASFSFQSIAIRPMESEDVELSSPMQIKLEPQEQVEPQQKPAEIVISPLRRRQEVVLRTSERKDYIKRKDSLTSSQIIVIFKRLITAFLSQETNLSKEKAAVKKALRNAQQIQGYDTLFELVFQSLRKKFTDFKKTKEEMIKYIIRRTYHNYKISKGGEFRPQLDRLEQFHQKNLNLYKSMNSDFLRRQFSNKLFVEIYKEFLDQMDEQFQKENEERIERLAFILDSAWAERNLKLIAHEKKLPWNMNYKRRVKQIAFDLLKEFQPQFSEMKGDLK